MRILLNWLFNKYCITYMMSPVTFTGLVNWLEQHPDDLHLDLQRKDLNQNLDPDPKKTNLTYNWHHWHKPKVYWELLLTLPRRLQYRWILIIFLRNVSNGTRNEWLEFGGDTRKGIFVNDCWIIIISTWIKQLKVCFYGKGNLPWWRSAEVYRVFLRCPIPIFLLSTAC